MNFTFLGSWYICIPIDICELHSEIQLGYKYTSQLDPPESYIKALLTQLNILKAGLERIKLFASNFTAAQNTVQ